ncbi:hypothetical protein NL676_038195 [Syzygium grande]|nr:hypothetical protein NL676_038195 [Syzygium grande]
MHTAASMPAAPMAACTAPIPSSEAVAADPPVPISAMLFRYGPVTDRAAIPNFVPGPRFEPIPKSSGKAPYPGVSDPIASRQKGQASPGLPDRITDRARPRGGPPSVFSWAGPRCLRRPWASESLRDLFKPLNLAVSLLPCCLLLLSPSVQARASPPPFEAVAARRSSPASGRNPLCDGPSPPRPARRAPPALSLRLDSDLGALALVANRILAARVAPRDSAIGGEEEELLLLLLLEVTLFVRISGADPDRVMVRPQGLIPP